MFIHQFMLKTAFFNPKQQKKEHKVCSLPAFSVPLHRISAYPFSYIIQYLTIYIHNNPKNYYKKRTKRTTNYERL